METHTVFKMDGVDTTIPTEEEKLPLSEQPEKGVSLISTEENKVVTRKTFYCTHQGELLGIPTTGKRVAIDVIDILQLAGGKITNHWAVVDLLGLMQQLGVFPPTGQAS